MTECEKMKAQIQQLEFALVELNLFLDSHPHCTEALQYYKELVEQHRAAVTAYEKQCAPITAGGNVADQWDWVIAPFPWELSRN